MAAMGALRTDRKEMTLVVDASVALKWQFEDEEATDSATQLLKDYVEGNQELVSPTLFAYEVLSGIQVAIRRGRISETSGLKAFRRWQKRHSGCLGGFRFRHMTLHILCWHKQRELK